MELGDIQLSEVVVVSGCGPLGLGMVAAARLKNPRTLIALDLLDWKVGVHYLIQREAGGGGAQGFTPVSFTPLPSTKLSPHKCFLSVYIRCLDILEMNSLTKNVFSSYYFCCPVFKGEGVCI